MNGIFLTDKQLAKIATAVNKEINLPFVGEEAEQMMFRGIVSMVVRVGQTFIPYQWGKLMHDVAVGISPEREDEAVDWLTRCINKNVDVPFMSEDVEVKLIRPVAKVLIGGLVKGRSLETQTNKG